MDVAPVMENQMKREHGSWGLIWVALGMHTNIVAFSVALMDEQSLRVIVIHLTSRTTKCMKRALNKGGFQLNGIKRKG